MSTRPRQEVEPDPVQHDVRIVIQEQVRVKLLQLDQDVAVDAVPWSLEVDVGLVKA